MDKTSQDIERNDKTRQYRDKDTRKETQDKIKTRTKKKKTRKWKTGQENYKVKTIPGNKEIPGTRGKKGKKIQDRDMDKR